MNLDITSPEEIIQELTQIDKFLNITCSEQIEEVVNRGNDLAVYIARSGKLLADAKYHLNEKMKDEIFETIKEAGKQAKATPTAINGIIKSLCKKEQYMVDWSERINRGATHQLDWCRTLISKAKEEMRISGNYQNSGF
ncbi:hypothetical protein SAMN05216357_11044 [Porphyromonadaceae bacterium KH3CP3RA]|nr:hypothetical protein SAMN05216357_11044 [Porphyromonadaceae bacterium KH3CP3RA]